jgi:quinoprotein dehydrogenase-associated probable ABC transporter substrate-binding protein
VRAEAMRAFSPLLLAAAFAAWFAAVPAACAQMGEILDRTQLRVCADPNNLPFSNEKGEGFENKIAQLLGAELKLPVSYVFFPQVTGFVRNTLRARSCDLIMGAVAGDDIVQTTNPYYHSAYMAVYRADKDFAFTDFNDPKLRTLRLGIVSATPPANLLVTYDLLGNARSYALVVDTRYESPAHQMLNDLAKDEVDVGFLWGPIAGYYIKHENLPLKMAVLPNEAGAPRMEYRIAMGVRANEPEWRRRINAVILKQQPQITAILHDYGIPLLDAQGRLQNPP